MLVEDDPTYFYSILPYAYALGLSDIWAEHFPGSDLGTADLVLWPGWLDDVVHAQPAGPQHEFIPASHDLRAGFLGFRSAWRQLRRRRGRRLYRRRLRRHFRQRLVSNSIRIQYPQIEMNTKAAGFQNLRLFLCQSFREAAPIPLRADLGSVSLAVLSFPTC